MRPVCRETLVLVVWGEPFELRNGDNAPLESQETLIFQVVQEVGYNEPGLVKLSA